jgi:hypothetical protein
MPTVVNGALPCWKTVKSIKKAIDPNLIIAPGHDCLIDEAETWRYRVECPNGGLAGSRQLQRAYGAGKSPRDHRGGGFSASAAVGSSRHNLGRRGVPASQPTRTREKSFSYSSICHCAVAH